MPGRWILQLNAAVFAGLVLCGPAVGDGGIPFADVTVLHDHSGLPAPRCPGCELLPIDVRRAAGRPPPRMIVVVGHSVHGSYLNMSVPAFARKIAALNQRPELLVLDTCFGASADLLAELLRNGVTPGTTLAWPGLVAGEGFAYGALFAGDAVNPAGAAQVACCGGRREPVTVIPRARLAAVVEAAESTRQDHAGCRFTGRDAGRSPTLVAIQVAGVRGEVLVEIPSELIASCEPPPTCVSAPVWVRWSLVGVILLLLLGLMLAPVRRRG